MCNEGGKKSGVEVEYVMMEKVCYDQWNWGVEGML